MAAPGEIYNDSCLVVPGLPRRRLVRARFNDDEAEVVFETGGFARVASVVHVKRRTDGKPGHVQFENIVAATPDR